MSQLKFAELVRRDLQDIHDYIATGIKGITEGNYLIFYHDISGGIMIVRVFHTARDIKKIFKVRHS
jgi:plasmid stabilization system protein ParE